MKAKAAIDVAFDDAKAARSAMAALQNEAGFRRARIRVRQEGNTLKAGLDADDIVAFRAALNGLLRNLQVFESIEQENDDSRK